MDLIFHELGIPRKQLKATDKNDRFIAIVHNAWLKKLSTYEWIDFMLYDGTDIWSSFEQISESWSKIYIRVFKKQNCEVIPLPRCHAAADNTEPPLSFCQLLHYVSQSNHKNIWKNAHKQYKSTDIKESHSIHPSTYDIILRETINRIYGGPFVNKGENNIEVSNLKYDSHCNVYPILCPIETKSCIFLIYDKFIEHNLFDCITYSPAILDLSYNKPLFIIYQLLNILKSFHDRGLVLGNITLKDIYVTENLWVQIMPSISCNIHDISNMKAKLFNFGSKNKPVTEKCRCSNCLKTLSTKWVNWQISNYDYLLILNELAGRKKGEPCNHYVMPWITDFTSRCGNNWRDLTKSKYRLNKGDRQLDLTFTTTTSTLDSPLSQIPHHVSDILSDITYYVYMARRTPKEILTKHVRSKWVPAEYPSSIQRLQEWTPDECVPEFYTDPSVFRSIHEDLSDLELPAWASCAEDFIAKHREALESQHVSERLHHWIDLTFGYKLSGNAAVKAKNVCLSLVDKHSILCKGGIVQLFDIPHPARHSPGPFESKLPPRMYFNNDKRSISPRLTRSSEDLTFKQPDEDCSSFPNNPKSPASPSTKLDHIRTVDNVNYHTISKSQYNMIHLPKEYNPVSQLNSIENLHTFISKTFQKSNSNSGLHNLTNLDEDVDNLQNAFTNKIFTDNYEKVLEQNIYKYDRSFNYKHIAATYRLRELQILGCIIVEIFLAQKLRPLGLNFNTDFQDRVNNCICVVKTQMDLLPKCVQYTVKLLLQIDSNENEVFRYPTVTEKGLPPPSPHQLLQPLLGNSLFPFPHSYPHIYTALSTMWEFENTERFLSNSYFFQCNGQECSKFEIIESTKFNLSKKLSECKIKTFVLQAETLFNQNTFEQFRNIDILLPFAIALLKNPNTSILAVWYLFDPVARCIGVRSTKLNLLQPILKLYEGIHFDKNDLTIADVYRNKKSVKLYHHSFLLRLIVRLGLQCFLENFIAPLVEAVGGNRDLDRTEFGLHIHKNDFTKSKSNNSMKYNIQSPDLTESDKTLSPDKNNSELELFDFDEDKSPHKFDFIDVISETELPLNHSTAEEAIEGVSFDVQETDIDGSSAYKLGDFVYNTIDDNLSFNEDLTSNDKTPTSSDKEIGCFESTGPKSPVIPIPVTLNRTNQLSSIGCEIGSKKSVDSLDMPSDDANKTSIDSNEIITIESNNQKKSTDNNMYENKKQSKLVKKIKSAYTSYYKISDISTDSLIWLSHRLGPVLSARYLSRNLLKMLSLCYLNTESLEWLSTDFKYCTTPHINNLDCLTIADARIIGDKHASKVLECLISIAALYGEQFILLQYLPHMSEMIIQTKKRLTTTLQGGLLGSLQLLKHIIPYLTDVTLMDQLQDVLLKSILHPLVKILGSTRYQFPGGSSARRALTKKFLDTLYALAIRIGAEMCRKHLCLPIIQRFFLIFDKSFEQIEILRDSNAEPSGNMTPPKLSPISAEDSNYLEIRRDGSTAEWRVRGSPVQISHVNELSGDSNDSNSPPTLSHLVSAAETSTQKAMLEIQDVFDTQLALAAYSPFYKHLGVETMDKILPNHALIKDLCQIELSNNKISKRSEKNKFLSSKTNLFGTSESSGKLDTNTGFHCSNSFGSNVSIIGNRIEVQSDASLNEPHVNLDNNEMLALVSNKMDGQSSSRHLRGNWLAYWEHEIGRADKDTRFNLKQIKLQSYSGHTNAVRTLVSLDNENSFMSGSRDKTVKLWALRSQGDGSTVSQCQWTYTSHKKSILSLTFLDAPRLAVSCDSTVHVWDPFIGRRILTLDSSNNGHQSSSTNGYSDLPVNVVRGMTSPSYLVLAGTTESTVRMLDVRCKSYMQDLKISPTPIGIVRCLCVAPSGNWIAVGLSSGWLALLESRCGVLRALWKAHEGELLQIVAMNEEVIISSSLDHAVSVWSTKDGKILSQLKGPTEPVHCLNTFYSELISGTTANRIGVHTSVPLDVTDFYRDNSVVETPMFCSTKLRSETFKGILTSMSFLPLNRLLLLGSDTGNITLMC